MDVLAKAFLSVGYTEAGDYIFEEKKLRAKHFENKAIPNAPRIFISELLLELHSDYLQKTIRAEIDKIAQENLQSKELVFKGNVWSKPSIHVYEKLRGESEYAAWLYVYGFRANHFTVSINSLKKYNTIEKVNNFLKQNKFVLNASGGEIKGTPEELLQQSSTMADIIAVEFADGKYKIPAC